jgi:hypothetical protein
VFITYKIFKKKGYISPADFGGGDQKQIARFLYCVAIGSPKKRGGAKMFFTFIIHL